MSLLKWCLWGLDSRPYRAPLGRLTSNFFDEHPRIVQMRVPSPPDPSPTPGDIHSQSRLTRTVSSTPLGLQRGNCFPLAYVKPLCLVCISVKDWDDVHYYPSKVIWWRYIHQQTPVLNTMKPCEQCGSLRLTKTISKVAPFASFSLSHELCVEENCVPIFSRLSFSNVLFCCGFLALKTLVSGRLWHARLFAFPTNVSPVKQVLNQSGIKSNTWSLPCIEQPTDWR